MTDREIEKELDSIGAELETLQELAVRLSKKLELLKKAIADED